jgi:cell division protein FtsW
MRDFKNNVKLLATVVPVVAVIAYNNLSTAIIIMGIAVVMVFVSSPKYAPFVLIGAGAVLVASVFVFSNSGNYRLERIQIWLHPEDYDKGYQTLQGLYAIGSGGLFGKGLGESIQKLGFVPEAQNDMIFSIICEELGLFGAICVILMFLLLLWRFLLIALKAKDMFGSYLMIGIMTHIALQVILNIAVVTNTIPNTGITLPFISYGGTSIMILLAEMGVALSVSKDMQIDFT